MKSLERSIRKLNDFKERIGSVVYRTSRDQRARDNRALVAAKKLADKTNSKLYVAFCLQNDFLGAGDRQFDFMLRGLRETIEDFSALNLAFAILEGEPKNEIPKFLKEIEAGAIFTDFDPLKIKRYWQKEVADKIEIPFYEVDAHNIVPCRIASSKQEYGAYTIRPKIKKALPEFLEDFPEIESHRANDKTEVNKITSRSLGIIDRRLSKAVPYDFVPGAKAAKETLRKFIGERLQRYPEESNDPNSVAISDLSPYLHFGQISAQRVALEVSESEASQEAKDAFLEQLIVRRELADNFCCYNQNYDDFSGFPSWAQATLNKHRDDIREIWSYEAMENADTPDKLWNAAQRQQVETGKMHNYMRMYWAKKILEHSENPESAQQYAIALNDKYELDGRDPNGYAGIAWATGGVHDRAWAERPIYGKIRYMNERGARRKFDVDAYVEKFGG